MTRMMTALLLTTVLAGPAMAKPQVAQSMSSGAPTPNATGCQLQYGGGALLQHVKVFDVFYNTGNPYKDKLTAYYTAITQSAHMDWLSEYNVPNYKIGRGSFLGLYEDSNSTTTSISLDDSQIGQYLDGLIAAKKIPAPDDDTIYQIYFPANVSITLQGSQSCSVFCAYHNGYMHGSQIARYSVIPDVTKPPCAGGCGRDAVQFNNLTSVSSHELIEAVTDPDNNGSWVDHTSGCGEIGDICNGQQGTVAGFTVQTEWSNSRNACIVINDKLSEFSVAAAPTTVTVPVGGMATTTVTLTQISGMAETANLSATAPTGLALSFAPTSATTANGTSMLTISAGPTATVGMQKLTIKAAGTSITPTTDITVMVVPPPDMAMSPDLAQPVTGGGGGGSGGSGGGGAGGGTGGNGGSGGTGGGGSGGNGNNGGGGASGCSVGGGQIAGAWAVAGLLLLALAFRRRRA